ncbi:Uncharacterised protein [Pseudomonas aeruginosa]|nr:Uncharacterised protein [Pseudomonas aeruginosa]
MRPCSDSYYERHPNYEIGFVEYSERGNDFAPARTQRLIDQLKRYSARGDIAMVVFIHGWKHNAGRDDGNVASFNKALRQSRLLRGAGQTQAGRPLCWLAGQVDAWPV